MYLDYVRTFLEADERLSAKAKGRIAQKIISLAERNDVQDTGQLHDKLAEWVDRPLFREQFFVQLNRQIGEDTELGSLIEDPRASAPPEIITAGSEKTMTTEELQDFISEEFPDLAETSSLILSVKPDALYRESDLNPEQIEHRLMAVVPRVRNGRLLIPDKQILSVGFDFGSLQIQYKRGYSDEKVQKAIDLWLAGNSNVSYIAREVGINNTSVTNWLYSCGLRSPRKKRALEEVTRDVLEYVRLYSEKNGKGPNGLEIRPCGSDYNIRLLVREGLLVYELKPTRMRCGREQHIHYLTQKGLEYLGPKQKPSTETNYNRQPITPSNGNNGGNGIYPIRKDPAQSGLGLAFVDV